MPSILPLRFYQRDTTSVARDLLGQTLVRIDSKGQRLSGRIVETEAYLGIEDPACHTFGGRRTPRVRSMYLAGGHSYVYFVYGMHFCFNVVTRSEREPEAVLIRALEPVDGLEVMRERRSVKRDRDLASGPARLCASLGIDRSFDGLSLDRSPLFIERGKAVADSEVITAPRIGIAYAGDAALWPLRFFVNNNVFVSKRS